MRRSIYHDPFALSPIAPQRYEHLFNYQTKKQRKKMKNKEWKALCMAILLCQQCKNSWKNSKKPDDHHQVAGLQRFMQGGLRYRWAHHRHRECCHHHQGCCHHPRYRHRPPASALRCSPCASSGCPWADSSRRWSSRSEPPSTRQPSSHHCRGWQRGRYQG